jgi:predicted alpha/beta superfamily hydrolase
LAALEIARRNPHTFAGVIAMSPSLWWDHHATISELNRDPGGLAQARIWLDVGTDEDEANSAAPVDDVKALDAVLTKHQIKHHLLIVPGAHHDEIAWANRFGDAIKFLMGASLAAK